MRAGRLRHRITIENPVESPGAYNEARFIWQKLIDTWASVKPLQGREYFASQQAQSEVTHEVMMRYCEGITPRSRVVFGERVFDIRGVINTDERCIELKLMCVEHGAENLGVSS